MPFKTLYQIFDSKHTAPVFSNTDYKMAYVEWRAYLRKGGDIYRLQQTVMPGEELTKSEKYLYLVYRLRKAWKQFINCGRKEEDIKECRQLERELDDWNSRTRKFIDTHCMVKDAKTQEGYNFFILVETWLETCKKRKKYSPKNGFDEIVQKEVSRECKQYAREIDNYIKTKLNLL